MHRCYLAVVGAGPRSILLLDRLLAAVEDGTPPGGLAGGVAVIDPFPAGSGRVWDPEQSRALVMNTAPEATTVFPDPGSPLRSPWAGLTFAVWCRAASDTGVAPASPDDVASIRAYLAASPDWVRDAAVSVEPSGYAPRALFGHYLRWAYAAVADRLRARIPVSEIRDAAIDVVADASAHGGAVIELASGDRVVASAVVLSPGWLLGPADGTPAAPHGPEALAPASPGVIRADLPGAQPIERIPPGEQILIQGFGMNALDTVTLLTQGRGGRFARDGALAYIPSGREPRIRMTSGRGRPLWAQSAPGSGTPAPASSWFDRAVDRRDPLDHALAALRRDAECVYLLAAHGDDPLLRAVSDPDLTDEPAWREEVERRFPGEPRFDLAGWRLDPAFDLPDDLARALDIDIARAEDPGNAVKLALATLPAARVRLPELLPGGVDSDSDRASLAAFLGFAGHYGGVPPLFRIRELRALIGAGVVAPLSGGPGAAVESIEAYMPPLAGSTSPSRLIRSLLDRGVLTTVSGYRSGSAAIRTDREGRAITESGRPHPRVFVLGPLTEGHRVFTIVAPIAGRRSPLFVEADTVVRALSAGRTPDDHRSDTTHPLEATTTWM